MDFSALASFGLLPWQWAAWIAAGIAAGLSKTGFTSASSVIVPIIALIFGARESTGFLLPALCFADLLAVIYFNRHTEWKFIVKLLPWTVAGIGAAFLTASLVPVGAFRYIMGCGILAGIIVMAWTDYRGKEKPPPSAWWFSALFGIAGGFCSAIGNVAGPIMAVFLLSMRLPKNSYVGTTAWFFLIVNYLKLPLQIILWKNINAETLLLDLTLVPAIIAGSALGIFLIKIIPEKIYRRTIMILTLLSTVLLFI